MRTPWIALALAAGPPALAAPLLVAPGAPPPPIVERLGADRDARLVEIAPDGRRAAVALTRGEARHAESTVRVFDMSDPPREVEIPGRVRALLFSPDASEIFVIQERPAKKRRAPECFLVRVDVASLQARRTLYLPATSNGLTHWPAGNALLIAARDEIRSLLLPDLNSGPLYRLPGDNRAVAVVEGSRVLVGRGGELLLVDLADAPDREGMPVREATPSPGAVVALAVDRSTGHARLGDDTLLRVGFAPLRLAPTGAAPAAATVAAAAPPPAPPVATATPLPPPAEPAAPPSAARADAPAPPEPPPVQQEAAAVEPPEPPAAADIAALAGTVSGDLSGDTLAVVAYGPDDILREAARVSPAADGTWRILGLRPGRYRVLLDGGGRRVLVTDPPYHVAEIGDAALPAPTALDFRVLRSM